MLIHMQGDTFLRSAYIVFDLENEEISIGKARYNVTDSKILEIGKGKGSVPGATAAEHVVTAIPTATGGGRSNNMPLVSGDMTRIPGGFATGKSSAASALGVSDTGIFFVMLCGAVVGVFVLWGMRESRWALIT